MRRPRSRVACVSSVETVPLTEPTASEATDRRVRQRMAQRRKKLDLQKQPANHPPYGPAEKDLPTMSYPKKDMAEARAMSVKAQNGFRTDNAISSGRPGGERTLQRWVPDSMPGAADLSLDNGKPGTTAQWDQFKVNEQLFGLRTNYDENMYTTQIDTSHPDYHSRVAAADKKALEIQRSVAVTSHVAEERTMDYAGGDDQGRDEEDKYSGVKRHQDFPPLPSSSNNNGNKYTPPARRAPAPTSSVKGAPVDPAIISAQLKTSQRPSSAAKKEDGKTPATSAAAKAAFEPKIVAKTDVQPQQKKPTENQSATAMNQTSVPVRPSAATGKIDAVTTQGKDGTAPSASQNVEHDVLKEFKNFATRERITIEKARSTKLKADKEVKLTELKKFSANFKLDTPLPPDLIGIIAKDPSKQREIQEKTKRDAEEMAKKKAEEATGKDKKPVTTKDGPAAATQGSAAEKGRVATAAIPTPSTASTGRHAGGRQNYGAPHHQGSHHPHQPNHHHQVRNDQRYGPGPAGPVMGPRPGSLATRLRHEHQRLGGPVADFRSTPTGPAMIADHRRGHVAGPPNLHQGMKLNPNSHEFRPNPFATSFNPSGNHNNGQNGNGHQVNGHPVEAPPISGPASPPSASNSTATDAPTFTRSGFVLPPLALNLKKGTKPDAKKYNILEHLKSVPCPEGKDWSDNDGVMPAYDTPPVWRQRMDDEGANSTMNLTVTELFEKYPYTAPKIEPVPSAMPHQHQLPFHLQAGAHSVVARHSPRGGPPVQMTGGQLQGPPHTAFNGLEEQRMMPSSSAQSYASPRLTQVPVAYAPNMNAPVHYNQGGHMPSFIPGTPQMAHLNRSFSNHNHNSPQQYMPHHPQMPMMMPPQFMGPQGVPAPQQGPMYPAGPNQFIPPGGGMPQPMPGANGYPSPGRPAAATMMDQGSHQSHQGQPMYGMSPGIHYQQPVFPPPHGQMNNMRGYGNGNGTGNGHGNGHGPQQFGGAPQPMHHYGPQHRNGSNNFGKGYQVHSQHQQQGPPNNNHHVSNVLQGRAVDGPDEAK